MILEPKATTLINYTGALPDGSRVRVERDAVRSLEVDPPNKGWDTFAGVGQDGRPKFYFRLALITDYIILVLKADGIRIELIWLTE